MKNIVLDIDNTLVYSTANINKFKNLKLYTVNNKYRKFFYKFDILDPDEERLGEGLNFKLCGIFRPYLFEFIKFIEKNFDNIIIWSAGKKRYVEKICNILFKDIKIYKIFSFYDCEYTNGIIYKDLKKIFNDTINETNTILIDDNKFAFKYNEKNGILIPRFEIDFNQFIEDIENDNKDIVLYKLIIFLNKDEFKYCKDVREIDYTKIF